MLVMLFGQRFLSRCSFVVLKRWWIWLWNGSPSLAMFRHGYLEVRCWLICECASPLCCPLNQSVHFWLEKCCGCYVGWYLSAFSHNWSWRSWWLRKGTILCFIIFCVIFRYKFRILTLIFYIIPTTLWSHALFAHRRFRTLIALAINYEENLGAYQSKCK
jgi:hypothetical protein